MKPCLDVVFVTYNGLPHGDPDDLFALSLLEAKGLKVAIADWRALSSDALDSRLVVLRSTWNYHQYYRDFLDWIDVVASRTTIKNDSSLIHWNADKKYLLDLAQSGVAIVPTTYIERTKAREIDVSTLGKILSGAQLGSGAQIVVKPTVGLCTYGVQRFALEQEALVDICAHVVSLAVSSDVLIQPYITAVEKYGERSLVFIDNQFSHSVRKNAFQKLAVAGDAGEIGVVASGDEIAFGQHVLSKLSLLTGCGDPLYARVDVVPDDYGRLMLLELELIEPSLFLAMDPRAGNRFAQAIAALLD